MKAKAPNASLHISTSGLIERGVEDTIMALAGKFDLSGVEAIRSSPDLVGLACSIDRGVPIEASHPSTDAIGVTLPVLREGQLKTVILLKEDILKDLAKPHGNAEREWALHVIAHEFAHAELFEQVERKQKVVLRRLFPIEASLWEVFQSIYHEYWASARSAKFGNPDVRGHLELLITLHKSASPCSEAAARLIGTIDGLSIELDWLFKNISTTIAGQFIDNMQKLAAACRKLPDKSDSFATTRGFAALAAACDPLNCPDTGQCGRT